MKQFIAFLLLVLFATACKTIRPDTRNPENNGTLVASMERTPCFGRCPVYSVKIYDTGLLVYEAKKFADTTGCFYRVLSKQEMAGLRESFNRAGFFKLADKYPEEAKAPTDLPSCIVFYTDGTAQKTVTDKRWETPETLTRLEKGLDSLIHAGILHNCDN
jgi:hypothetical protein